jgi:hypothetical protein
MPASRVTPLAPSGRIAAARSFVVQLHPLSSTEADEPMCGRVENVATGEFTDFTSMQELDQFMRLIVGQNR